MKKTGFKYKEMTKIMHMLFLSCLKASQLIEKKIHFGLSFKEKIQLKLHKTMCDACSRYERQSELLEKGISSLMNEKEGQKDLDGLKHQITQKLSEHKK